ncbi:MAG: DUF2868 domain-containing protein [Gammaproteobacteria bacterium]|nr:DUF2868 domain-containing protein [Gammaproteobacteria bacterium]
MARQPDEQSTFADLVDLKIQLELDRTRDPDELHRRDRKIGRELSAQCLSDRRAQLRQWLRHSRDPEHPQHGARAVLAYRVTALILAGVGLIIGCVCAGAAFYYDGSQPVNVVTVLALFVALQLLLLALLGLATIPSRLARGVPGLRTVQQMLTLLSPGRLMPWIVRILPQSYRELLQQVLASGTRLSSVYGNVGKWGVLLGSQVFALAFNLGALATCLYLVVFSDLAFGWSTTLQTSADGFHSLVLTIAAPWSQWFNEGVPSLELVTATRYFRIDAGEFASSMNEHDAAALGGWWPFLVAAMICYGLLPRIVTTLLSAGRLRASIHHAFTHMPGAARILDRMNSEIIEMSANGSEVQQPSSQTVSPPSATITLASDKSWVVRWAGIKLDTDAINAHLARYLQTTTVQLLDAGGSQSLEDDARVIEQLAQTPSETQLVLLVKSWEPPLMELVDFLKALRQALPKDRAIIVLPVALDQAAAPIAPSPSDVQMWGRKIRGIGDPWLDIGINHQADPDV